MKTYRNLIAGALAALFLCGAVQAQPVKRTRYPAISPDGKTIVFTFQGDLWTVSSKGGRARRLTIHPARDIQPVVAPDGKQVLFASNRYGNYDLFLMPIDGGKPKRLTYNSSSEYPSSFTPDGSTIIFYSGAYGSSDIFKMPATGGEPIRLTWDYRERKFFGQVSPDGTRIAFNLNGNPGQWRSRGYKGSYQSDIWIAGYSVPITDPKRLTDNKGQDFLPMWSQDGKRLYYVSDRDGEVNIWRMNPEGGEKTQITTHKGDGVRIPSYAAKAHKMVYEYESGIYLLDTRSRKTAPVTIEIESDERANRISERTYTSATEYTVSPDGKKIALIVRGDVFVMPASGGTARRLTNRASRESHIAWAKDSRHIIFATDQKGNKDLHVVNINSREERVLVDSEADETNVVLSPDGKLVGFHRGETEICSVPLEGGEVTVLAKGNFSDPSRGYTPRFDWSSDGKWIAFEQISPRMYESIWVQEIGNGESHRVSPYYRHAHTPHFTRDNSMIYYTAEAVSGDRLYVVDTRTEPEPTFDEDAIDKLDAPKKSTPKPDGEVHLDFDNVLKKVRAITPRSTNVGDVLYVSRGDRFIYQSSGSLYSVDANSRNSAGSRLASGGSGLERRGTGIFFITSSGLKRMSLISKQTSSISFRATVTIDMEAENKQIFDEIWWLMDRFYYDAEHSGSDWKQIRQKYADLLQYATTKPDFYDMMLEMVLEINGSHLGVGGPSDYSAPLASRTAFLGVEPDWKELSETGLFKVASVVMKSPADNRYSKIKPGEYILAINGVDISADNTFDKLLDRQSGKKVTLLVNDKPTKEGARKVVIKPVGSGGGLRYQQWLEQRRQLTKKLSDGKVAYLHIQSMNGSSERLFREQLIAQAADKKGLIVDVRFNGGGNVAHNLLDILRKRPYVTFRPRTLNKQVPVDWFGGYMWARPAALLINQTSASNSEMMALGFKKLDVGPVVGVPTMGAVIATGSWRLMDGGRLRMPSTGVFSADGEDLEVAGRKPDLVVPYDPMAIQAGKDPQLEAAIKLVMKQIEKKTLGRKDLAELLGKKKPVAAEAGSAQPAVAKPVAIEKTKPSKKRRKRARVSGK